MQKELNIKTTDKKTIFGTLDTPKGKSKGIIIFLHGLTLSIHEPIIKDGSKYFIKQGFTTYRFNFYGEEKNTRKLGSASLKDHIADTNKVIEYFTKKGFKNIFLVGHSFGGLTILYSKLADISAIILRDASIGGKELLSDVIYNKKTKQHIIDRGDGINNLKKYV